MKSMVTGQGTEKSVYHEGRTSSTSYFDESETLKIVEKRICQELGASEKNAEPSQGQLYHENEFFEDHTDFFDKDSYINECLASGQRTWTVMIYLNDVEEGGHTEFTQIGKSFKPIKGTAVIWQNSDGTGAEYHATLHSGRPVIKGKKMIITKWFRENEYRPLEDQKLANQHHSKTKTPIQVEGKEPYLVRIEEVDGILHARYGDKSNIPKITKEGFKKLSIPKELYSTVLKFYDEGLSSSFPEFDPNNEKDHARDYISSKEVQFPTRMIELTEEMKTIIFDGLQSILEDWSGRVIQRTYCYGIRIYNQGAVLKKHTDGFETRIVSGILNIDQKVDEPWALQIDDHQGVEHELYLEPGEMILYESAILDHGRIKPLKGEYFSNLFVHFINLS